MSRGIPGLLPDDFPEDWALNWVTLPGRRIVSARRRGITIQLVLRDRKWHITKIKGGKVIREMTVIRLPSDLTNELERRRRRERHAEAGTG